MDLQWLKNNLDKVVTSFQWELTKIQTWRANTGIVEGIDVFIPEWNQKQKIQGLGSVTVMDAHTLRIESWDKTVLPKIEKAIYDSGTWLSPTNQWDRIMVKVPPMTEERRKDIVKLIYIELEKSKIAIRNHRQDAMKLLKKEHDDKEISEDEKKASESNVEDAVKENIVKLDEIGTKKEKDIMTM